MTCEILISISLGDNFPLKDDYLLKDCKTHVILVAKFNDDILQSDPIEINSINPELATELGFRINRKDFHQFRTERKSIKLQCFVEYSIQQQQSTSLSSSNSNEDNRHFIGYVILHLRDVQDYTVDPKYKWVVLLNPKYKGSSSKRPQLYLALMVNKINDNDLNDCSINSDQSTSLIESSQFTRSIKKEGKSYFLDSSMMSFYSDFNSNLSIDITNKCVYIWNKSICEQNDCQQIFQINIHLNRPKNLQNLLPNSNNKDENDKHKRQEYYFRYVLFGKQIKTNSFFDLINCDDYEQHKYSINIKTLNKDMLQEYFESYPTIEIQFCSTTNELIGFVTINLLKLFQQNNSFIYGNFVIVPEEESVYVKDPFPTINIRLFMLNNHLSRNNSNDHQQQLQQQPISVERPIDFINHYYIAIDLRTIKLLTNLNDENICQILFQPFYLQFSYAFFGATEPIKTYPSIQFSREHTDEEITIPHGFCGFNLATTYEKLSYTFENLPLIIQLILDEDNTLLGTSEISLKCLLNDDSNKDETCEKSLDQNNRSPLNDNFTQINTTVYDELSDQICELKVIMFIQELIDTVNNDNDDDYGDQQSRIRSQQMKKSSLNRKEPSANTSKPSIMTQSMYDEREIFESTTSDQRRQQSLIEKEKQLNELLRKLDERELKLFEQEKLLDQREKGLNANGNSSKFQNNENDLESIIQKLQSDYDDKLNQMKLKLKAAEEEKFRIQEKNYHLERKMKEKMQRIRELEAKVFELTQLNKRKTQQASEQQANNTAKRSIIIQRDYQQLQSPENNNIENHKSNLPIRSKSITRSLYGGGGGNMIVGQSSTNQNV